MEALILLLVILFFGFYSFPLYSYFAFIGVYSLIFCDIGKRKKFRSRKIQIHIFHFHKLQKKCLHLCLTKYTLDWI